MAKRLPKPDRRQGRLAGGLGDLYDGLFLPSLRIQRSRQATARNCPQAASLTTQSKILATGIVLTAMAIVIVALWLADGAPPSPLVPNGPAQQVAIEVDPSDTGEPALSYHQFVGHMTCAECHSEIHSVHIATPHANTFASTSESPIAQQFCGRTMSTGGKYGTYEYQCDDEGLVVDIQERRDGRLFPLEYAVGSGKHAVTFLTLLPDGNETIGVEHRMTWFRASGESGITPGQNADVPERAVDYFGRVFRGQDMRRCVSCHVTTGHIVRGRIENLTAGIHCERCHGPGKEHVQAAEDDDTAAATAAIRSKWSGADEVAMCGECHRMPDDLAPERLKRYPNSLVRFQPVGLLRSRCFTESAGRMKCTTCHDPHAPVESRSLAMQLDSCRQCHSKPTETHCAAGHSDGCIKCHMPAIELLPGISFHDHWIRVRDNDAAADGNVDDDAGHASAR